ncbi:MAG TPA: cellulase family glycosylhydrolase [Candidatus Limnocylindrales bacterium]
MKLTALALAAVLVLASPAPAPAQAQAHDSSGFVTRRGDQLFVDGKLFRFSGSNNYYLMYKSQLMVDDVFADAKAAGFTVLRTWGFMERGQEGVDFQEFDAALGRPVINDGPGGLERLDYVLASARRHGIRLIIPLTNNWNDFGGMDEYVRWAGGSFHDDFYTNPVIRGWYQTWITHLLNRVNVYTGVAYKNDPTVMAWELGNEPRCLSAGIFPRSPNCTTGTLIEWADVMTRHIKSVDRKHLVGVGDEGFFCDEEANPDWTRNCGEGVDTLAFARLKAVDLMSFHLYPDAWGKDLAWTRDWIARHVREAKAIGKPVVFGEFGWRDKATRNPVYKEWTDIFKREGGNGWLYWILSGIQDDGSLYPDFDGFTVYCPSPVCQTLTNATARRPLPPVADHDMAVTEFNQPATLTPPANDVAYQGSVRPSTIAISSPVGGTFTAAKDGVVTFTPQPDFVGRASAKYTIRDSTGRLSNVADLVVNVKPDPTAAIPIATFEAGTDGWGPGNWMPDAGTVTQTADFSPEGSFGLNLSVTAGHWFGLVFGTPLDLSTKSQILFELRTGASGTSVSLAVQTGPSFTWCQTPFPFIQPGTTTTFTADFFTDLSGCAGQFNDVRALYIFFNPGSFDIDNVRAV